MFYEILQFAPLFSFGYIDIFKKIYQSTFRTNKVIIYDLMMHHYHLTERCCTEQCSVQYCTQTKCTDGQF